MAPQDFKAWRDEMGLTQTQAAKAFGKQLRQVQRWEGGESPISQETALACWSLSKVAGKKPDDGWIRAILKECA